MTQPACIIDGLTAHTRFRDVEALQERFPFAQWVVSHGHDLFGASIATLGDWKFRAETQNIPLIFNVMDVKSYLRGDKATHAIAAGYSKLILSPATDMQLDKDKLAALIAKEDRPVLTPGWLFPEGPVADNHQMILLPDPRDDIAAYSPTAPYIGHCVFSSDNLQRDPFSLLIAAANTQDQSLDGISVLFSDGLKGFKGLDLLAAEKVLHDFGEGLRKHAALSLDAKAYWDKLRTTEYVSTSSDNLRNLHSDFGEKIVDTAMEYYLQNERDDAAIRSWERVQDLYAQHNAQASAEHPDKLKAEQILEVREAKASFRP